jgi:serine protease Do
MQPETGSVLGLQLSELTAPLRDELGLGGNEDGLVVTAVDPAAEAAEKGLQVGDVIAEAGQRPVSTPADLEDRIADARDAGRKSILLLVRRAGEPRFVALTVDE